MSVIIKTMYRYKYQKAICSEPSLNYNLLLIVKCKYYVMAICSSAWTDNVTKSILVMLPGRIGTFFLPILRSLSLSRSNIVYSIVHWWDLEICDYLPDVRRLAYSEHLTVFNDIIEIHKDSLNSICLTNAGLDWIV